ncbi:hypothetical protein [Nostoc sp. DSM 114161]|uniref:hypothetical protein n=1 Tax=Nostoc sp. DSM 114161 TaxID=3440143 RepID=UPI0040462B92
MNTYRLLSLSFQINHNAISMIIKKQEDFLEIIIPPAGIRDFKSITILGVMFIMPSIVLVFLVFAIYWVDLQNKIFLGLFSLPWLSIALAMLWLLVHLFANTRLKIDEQQISLTHEISGFVISQATPSSREDINKLERIKGHIKFSSPNDGGIIIEPKLVIWAGNNQYSISASPILSEVDLDLLANELSEWLKLTINKD